MKKRIVFIIMLILSLLTSCAAGGLNDSNEDVAVDGVAFNFFGRYELSDVYDVYKPNDFSEALVYSTKSFDTTSTSTSWIVNYEDISYYYSSKEIVESDEAISKLYEEIVNNLEEINKNLEFECQVEENNKPFIVERELANPEKEEIKYMLFTTYIPFLVKNISRSYEHFVYVPVYREIVMVNSIYVEDPFTKAIITMEVFEALYKQ